MAYGLCGFDLGQRNRSQYVASMFARGCRGEIVNRSQKSEELRCSTIKSEVIHASPALAALSRLHLGRVRAKRERLRGEKSGQHGSSFILCSSPPTFAQCRRSEIPPVATPKKKGCHSRNDSPEHLAKTVTASLGVGDRRASDAYLILLGLHAFQDHAVFLTNQLVPRVI